MSPARAQPRRHTVLVVDDEPEVVQSVKDLLRLDYRVLGATRAEEGLALMAREEIDVVMTDQRMPGMSGVEFLHRVRGEHPEAMRLLFTGYADIRAVIDAINQGNVYRYITKPWDPDELLSIIREAAGRHALLVERKELLRELHGKNQELQDKNQELRQSSALQEAFIQVASHELRTPLTIMLGLLWMMKREPELSPRVQDLVRRIDDAGQNLQRLITGITKMLAAGQFERPLLRAAVDVARLLREVVDEIRPFIELRQQSLHLELAADLGTLALDAPKIRDSLNNILMNAIKFTPDRGRIALIARRRVHEVEIRVSDTGIGIAASSLGLIFEPFFTNLDSRHHSSGTFEFGRRGIGLGLTVARAFIEMHQGTVKAESEVDQGTTLTITLPCAI